MRLNAISMNSDKVYFPKKIISDESVGIALGVMGENRCFVREVSRGDSF